MAQMLCHEFKMMLKIIELPILFLFFLSLLHSELNLGPINVVILLELISFASESTLAGRHKIVKDRYSLLSFFLMKQFPLSK